MKTDDARTHVLVELDPAARAPDLRPSFGAAAVDIDPDYAPVDVPHRRDAGFAPAAVPVRDSVVVRGSVRSREQLDALRAYPGVIDVWPDAPLVSFPVRDDPFVRIAPSAKGMADPSVDCTPGTATGTLREVAAALGADRLHAAGLEGQGLVVGIVDGGITAHGRPVGVGESDHRVSRVIDGWPDDWGTTSAAWSEHGNMCATDVLGMAPGANLHDLRIAGTGDARATVGRALKAFDWAVRRFRADGTPHVLTNSWGMYREAWDERYANDPAHPLVRKVLEAIDAGIVVLFAVGNCGESCPDGRCGEDVAPTRGIWGANGHPEVISVGAVNLHGRIAGYSSHGQSSFGASKPDVCAPTHFAGYFPSDAGTSAATPVLAGAVALLLERFPEASQAEIQQALRATAVPPGATDGIDSRTGAGLARVDLALEHLLALRAAPA